MPSLSIVRAANATFAPSSRPVALFVGGTSGIGQAVAEALAKYTKGDAHIIICGRNRTAAESIMASFPKPEKGPAPRHEFVQCDVTLMKNVHTTTKDLLSRLPKLNFLVLSPGFMTMRGRDETEEGIDRKLIRKISKFLFRAKDAGEDAKVMSVLGAGAGGAIDLDDLGLKKHYSTTNAALATPTYNDLMMEEFALRHPNLAFTHIAPGAVRTSLLTPSHWALRPFFAIFMGLLYPITVSPEQCAEYMLYALLDGEKGAFRRGSKGEDIGKTRYFSTEDARNRLWAHTVEATAVDGE